MEPKQTTIGEILDSEKEMVLRGAERYGEYFINASEFNHLLNQFLVSVDPDRFIFTMFLAQVRKHHTLALFSTARLHHVQAMLDMRYVLEAGASAAYAIVHPEIADFGDIDENGMMDATQELSSKRYKWLNDNYPDGSKAIFNLKKSINSSTAHSNIVYAHQAFEPKLDEDMFGTPFFDIENDFLVKTDLWFIANVAMGVMDLFYGVNLNRNVIKFADDFIQRLKTLETENHKLKAEMMQSQRFRSTLQYKNTTDEKK